ANCCTFKSSSVFVFLRYTGNLRVRRNPWLDRRPFTRPCLYTDPNGRDRDSPAKGLSWLLSTRRQAKSPVRGCSREPEANSSMALPFRRIHSGVSNLAL